MSVTVSTVTSPGLAARRVPGIDYRHALRTIAIPLLLNLALARVAAPLNTYPHAT